MYASSSDRSWCHAVPGGGAIRPHIWKGNVSSGVLPLSLSDQQALQALDNSCKPPTAIPQATANCSMVLLLGECNSAFGELSPTALSRVRRAVQLWQATNTEAGGGARLAAGSGFGPQFNESDTPHYELLRRQLMLNGFPQEAWLGGWPSEHTVHDALMCPALVIDWLRSLSDAQSGARWAAGCRVCSVDVVTSRSHMPRVQHLFSLVFTAMNNAASAGKYVACHTETLQFVHSPACALAVAVEWEQLGGHSWGRPEPAAASHCDWLLNVRFEEVTDPIDADELSSRLKREKDSLTQLMNAPYGVWRDWLAENVKFLPKMRPLPRE